MQNSQYTKPNQGIAFRFSDQCADCQKILEWCKSRDYNVETLNPDRNIYGNVSYYRVVIAEGEDCLAFKLAFKVKDPDYD